MSSLPFLRSLKIIIISLLLAIHTGTGRKYHDTLTMKSVFREGVWGEDEFCPQDEYVIGMQLRGVRYQGYAGRKKRDAERISVHQQIPHLFTNFKLFKPNVREKRYGVELKDVYPRDDYGLIAIRLICAPHWRGSNNNASIISSAYAYVRNLRNRVISNAFVDVPYDIPRGRNFDHDDIQYADKLYCTDSFANKFNVKQQKRQNTADDAGITNFKLTCVDGQQLSTKMDHEPGEWEHGDKACSKGNAICGIRTKLELDHRDDNTGLNDLIIYCCPPPKFADESEVCEPKKELQVVDTFVNRGFTVSKHTFRVKEGLSRQTGSRQSNKNTERNDVEIGFGVDLEVSGGISEFSKLTLKTRFDQKWGTSNTKEYGKEWSASDIFTENVEREHVAVVLPKSIIKLYQEVKTCGTFTLSSKILERRDEYLLQETSQAHSGTRSVHQLLIPYYLGFFSFLLLISGICSNL